MSTSNSFLNAPQSRHANFQSRSARDEFGELRRRTSTVMEEEDELAHPNNGNPYEPATNDSIPPPREHSLSSRLGIHHNEESANVRRRSVSGKRKGQQIATPQDLLSTAQLNNEAESKRANGEPTVPKAGLGPRPIGGSEKLGIFSGVYVPTVLNVLSILML